MLAIARAGGRQPEHRAVSMLDWLHRMKQTPGAIERFWRVVLVSALDEELARTDARYGIDVFWKAFLGSRSGYRVGIPSVPLASCMRAAAKPIAARGGRSAVARVACAKFACATADLRAPYWKTARQFRPMLASRPCRTTCCSDLLPKEMGEQEACLQGLRADSRRRRSPACICGSTAP